ncbi:unnamed protein product [Rotaria socialis]|uniref:Tetratricopeptide repeat protein n=1 Tax=Rotaria socialis TaxID=392032 RepID=A0A818EQC6_9BILA|nr:unnamed protein product [Rotaria socialis]CAF4858880.1 unnamed protein product [Rotaria socialis]
MNLDQIRILFEITIDRSIKSVPFTVLGGERSFTSEKEILFSMHSVFHVDDIERPDGTNRLWQVKLKQTADSDPQLSLLTKRSREETKEGSIAWDRMGKLLIKMSKFSKTEEIYRTLEENVSNENMKAFIYQQLGYAKIGLNQYEEALALYDKAIAIRLETLPSNNVELANCYNNIGTIHNCMADYSKGLPYFDKVLEIQKRTPIDDMSIGRCYDNIAYTYDRMGDYAKALIFNEKSLMIK